MPGCAAQNFRQASCSTPAGPASFQAMKWNIVCVSSIGTLTLATLYRLLGGISTVIGATNTVTRT